MFSAVFCFEFAARMQKHSSENHSVSDLFLKDSNSVNLSSTNLFIGESCNFLI